MRKPKPLAMDMAGESSSNKPGVPAPEAAPNTAAPDAIRDFIQPPTREQLMAGSANLRRVYKVEA